YGLSAITGARAHYDELMGAGALTREDVQWGTPGGPATVTWSVMGAHPYQTDFKGNLTPFIQLSAAQVAAVQLALAQFFGCQQHNLQPGEPGWHVRRRYHAVLGLLFLNGRGRGLCQPSRIDSFQRQRR